jgi:hypothetical protein
MKEATMTMLPHECPRDQILVQQVMKQWQVVHRDQPAESFDELEDALARALAVFREQRHERKSIIVLPPESPWMWD